MRKKTLFSILIVIISLLYLEGTSQANLLVNPGFEEGGDLFPDDWNAWGSGMFEWTSDDSKNGVMSMRLGGDNFALMYQRVPAVSEQNYELSAWLKQDSGSGIGTIKLEFHNSNQEKITEIVESYATSSEWIGYSVTGISPKCTAFVTAAIVGESGSTVLFDDISIIEIENPPPLPPVEPIDVVFDITNTSHTFKGFGAQVWPHSYNEYNNYHNESRAQGLEALNIKYIRIENSCDGWYSAEGDMENLRLVTDNLGIDWIYMIWAVCETDCDDNKSGTIDSIEEVECFAEHWANELVSDLYDDGIPVEYIELMNEPDSEGWWSTGISDYWYNLVVSEVRGKLDDAGFENVQIVGPGPAYMWSFSSYLDALGSDGISSMGVWSTHAWGTDIYGPYPQAGSSTEVLCKYLFTDSANNADPAMPKFVTEYATHEMTYNCVTYPHGDNYGGWNDELEFPYFCVTNCMPYAARVYENTLGLLNGGAEVPFIWQLNDEWSEVFDKGKGWGLIDLWGNEKPVYGALKTLYPKIPVGSQVVVPSDQSTNNLYTGAFVDDDQIIVGISNDNDSEYSTTIYLHNAPENLKITEAVAFEQSYWGNPETGEPDEGQQVEKDLDLLDDHDPGKYSFYVTLPANSTLTVVLEPISLGLEGAIVAWGKNDCGSEPVPQGDDFVDVACGYYHNLALRTDGTIAAWGSNYHGQCNIPELGYEEETYIDIACGKYHSLALTSQGRLVAWGRNKYGACETPKGNDFVAIACGDYHNLAIRNDGSLVTWGWDFYGQCDVPEGYDYVDISAGWAHSLAIKEDGSLVQWGKNNGSSYDSPGGDDFIDITASYFHDLALKEDGSLTAWGWNKYNRLEVPEGKFVDIALGKYHSVALSADGSLTAWGRNTYGQCDVPKGNNFFDIASNFNHNLALVFPGDD